MKKMKNLLVRACHVKALKYVAVSAVAVVLIGFIDENSVWHHLANRQRIGALESEIASYNSRYHHDHALLQQLEGDPRAIRKIARERYFMKADDEDIYVLSDDQPTKHTGAQ